MTEVFINMPVTHNIIDWYLLNNTKMVDANAKQLFKNLKNSVDGWKKGTNIRETTTNENKEEKTKIKENLSLFLNQLSQNNFDTVKNKIKKEVNTDNVSKNILLELIINKNLVHSNNLELLSKLVIDLNLIIPFVISIELKIDESKIATCDPNDYDQLCKDNINNLIYKNCYVIFGILYKTTHGISFDKVQKRINELCDKIDHENDKKINEKYLDILINLIMLVDSKIKKISKPYYEKIHKILDNWNQSKGILNNKGRFAILAYFESVNGESS